MENLTEKKIKILRLLTEGKRVKDVAKEIGLSTSTVSFHIRELKLLFDARTIPEIVCKAIVKRIV